MALFSRNKGVVGLDVGSFAVKLVELKERNAAGRWLFRAVPLYLVLNAVFFVAVDLHADFDHAAGDRRNFGLIGQHNSAARRLTAFIFPD